MSFVPKVLQGLPFRLIPILVIRVSRTTYIMSLSSHQQADRVTVCRNAGSYLRADRGAVQEGRSPETLWEDHQGLAERLEGKFGSLHLDGASP